MLALLTTIFLTACATPAERLRSATDAEIQAGLVSRAVRATQQAEQAARALPANPPECGAPVKAPVRKGDRLDAAVLKLDGALTKANNTLAYCDRWYDDLRKTYGPK